MAARFGKLVQCKMTLYERFPSAQFVALEFGKPVAVPYVRPSKSAPV